MGILTSPILLSSPSLLNLENFATSPSAPEKYRHVQDQNMVITGKIFRLTHLYFISVCVFISYLAMRARLCSLSCVVPSNDLLLHLFLRSRNLFFRKCTKVPKVEVNNDHL